MKNIKYYLLGSAFCAALVGFNSCKLESETYDSINAGFFPITEDDAEALVTANAYGVFRNNGYDGMFNIANGVLLASDLLSDYGECSWRQWASLMYLTFTNSGNDNNNTSNQWRWAQFMGKMTMTIDRIEKMDIPEESKTKYLAELHCARGWLAFCMWDLYGPIPIADIETLQNPLEEKILPRVSEDEMQRFIVDELTQAANVLPANYSKESNDFGRFTKGLCKTILMKFYMQTKNWPEAEKIGRELQSPEYGYDLVTNYSDIFTFANEKHAETIWAINCLRGTQEHKWHPHVLPNDYPNTDALTKWNGFKISWDFFNTFEQGDKRLETIIYEYVGTDGTIHNQTEDRKSTDNKLYYGAVPLKYDCKDFAGTLGENSETDYIIYRYADVLTLLAEAIVRNGNSVTEEAVELVNKIRRRAGLSEYEVDDFTTPQEFLDMVLLERGHEFVFEGVRRQDLIRHGVYVEAMKKKAQFAGQSTMAESHYERLPIPQSVIDEGKGQIEQNPGY